FGTVVHIRLNKSLGEADSVEEDDEDSVEDDDSDDGDYVPPNYVQTTKQPQLRGSRNKQVTDYFQVKRPRKFDCVEIPVNAKQLPASKKLPASARASASANASASASASASTSAKASSSASSASISASTRSGVVVGEVLSVLWIDNGPVNLLTTVHTFRDDEDVVRKRRRPRITSVNEEIVRATWGKKPRKKLKIPKIIDDYNHHMCGVDIADQRRGYYNTQIRSFRTWMPLFFWILDTAVVNCHLVHNQVADNITHADFRLQLSWALISLSCDMQLETQKRKTRMSAKQVEDELLESPFVNRHVTKHSNDLAPVRFLPGDHFPTFQEERLACVWCRVLAKAGKIEINKKCPPRSNVYCQACNAVLCLSRERNCFVEYHRESVSVSM
ncbi:hypothetical protein BC936DRAFT_142939, partial [Jimgerdemannia flammicorona]